MGKRLSVKERELIDQLDEQGYKPHEIGAKMGRDARTVKHYLRQRAQEQTFDWEKQKRISEHWNKLRKHIRDLEAELKLPPPENIDMAELSTVGERQFSFEYAVLRWQQAKDGSYRVILGNEFDCVIEHLRSSRQKKILDKLGQWERIGGEFIVNCHKLRISVKKEAERRTGLSTIPDNREEGLLWGFSWTIYSWALSGAKEEEYKLVSEYKGLRLLQWGMHNIAWVKENDADRIIDIQRKLIRHYRKLSTVQDILKGKQDLEQLSKTLCEKLNKFADLPIIPGKCDGCPG